MKFRSLKLGLTVIYAIFFTVLFIIYGAVLYFGLYNTLYDDLDALTR